MAPWSHCGQQVFDDEPCPACGITKSHWTVRLGLTQKFSLKRRGARVTLVDEAGEPVAYEPFVARFANGDEVRGTLSAKGKGTIPGKRRGGFSVEFPSRGATVEQVTKPTSQRRGLLARAGRFLASIRRKNAFRLTPTTWIEVELVDDDDEPLADVSYWLTDGGGVVHEGRTDSKGVLRHSGLPLGECKVRYTLPGEEEPGASEWLELELVDHKNQPLAGVRYTVVDPSGEEHDGQTDAKGLLRLDGLPTGDCKVLFRS